MENLPAVLPQRDVTVADFLPIFELPQALARRNAVVQYVQQLMVEGRDFGTIPGSNKPSLLKPGAEKLVTFFGMSPEFVTETSTEDWTGAQHGGEPFFYFTYRCRLTRNALLIGEGVGSCNSWESKYRYRWVPAAQVPASIDKATLAVRDSSVSEFAFAVDKAETGGQYGKPMEYWQQFRAAIDNGTAVEIQKPTKSGKKMAAWSIPRIMYQVPNKDVADVVNTVQKMAQKRALVAAVLVGVNASEFFTQDIEDMEIIDVTPVTVTSSSAQKSGSGVSTGAGSPATPSDAGERMPGDDDEPPPIGNVAAQELSDDEADMCLKMSEIDNMGTLTQVFNEFPASAKKVGGQVHNSFKQRMETLTKAARTKSQQRAATQP